MRILFHLNDHYRIALTNRPLQWLLQRHNLFHGADNWVSISFCQTRRGLLTAVKEKVTHAYKFYPSRLTKNESITPAARIMLNALPDTVDGYSGDAG